MCPANALRLRRKNHATDAVKLVTFPANVQTLVGVEAEGT